MITRQALLRSALAFTIVGATVLAGCASKRPSLTTEIYEAELTGMAEVPPVQTYGKGMIEAIWKPATMTLTYRATYSGLSGPATAAHFHGPATPMDNAGISLPVTVGTPQLMTIQGEAKLTPQQAADLDAGRWYFNIHTAANPGGEIRGQMRKRGG